MIFVLLTPYTPPPPQPPSPHLILSHLTLPNFILCPNIMPFVFRSTHLLPLPSPSTQLTHIHNRLLVNYTRLSTYPFCRFFVLHNCIMINETNQKIVGPAPPIFKLDLSKKTQDGRWIRTPEQQYRDHNLRLARSLGRETPRSYGGTRTPVDDYGQPLVRSNTSSQGFHTTGDFYGAGDGQKSAVDDVYKDFDSIYDTMCRQKPRIGSQSPVRCLSNSRRDASSSLYTNELAKSAALEQELLAKSLSDVEVALRRATCSPQLAGDNDESLLSPIGDVSLAYGKLISGTQRPQGKIYGNNLTITSTNDNDNYNGSGSGNGNHVLRLPSPVASQATTRADSCNTNQSFPVGPALVEEMTLSDLEDEICSSIMAVRESRSMMMQQPRTRDPLPLSLSRFTGTTQMNNNSTSHQIRAPANLERNY